MRLPLVAVVMAVAIFFIGQPAAAQTTGCCFTPAGFCVSDLLQLACDSAYTPNPSGSNYYSGQTCNQVSVCAVTGKCEKTDGASCSDKKKWECDDLYTQGYRFFQGQSCSAPITSTGTCCVQPPGAGGTIPLCEDNLDPTTCRDARLGTFYSTSCNTVSNCPQALTGAPPQTSTPVKKSPVVFDPEITLPLFSGGAVDGSTFASYIRAIFVYFIWSVGVLAVVMVIFGGVRWVAAAGDAGRINQAKDIIYNAIIGVVIGLTSVLLLNLIDPNLVNFRGISSVNTNQVVGIPYETDVEPGKFNEGASCKTKKGNPVQRETACVFNGTKLNWPVASTSHTINSRVGPRDAGSFASKCHAGTDFSTDQATNKPVLATHDGIIQAVGSSQRCGEFTMELHADSYYTRYVHVKLPAKKNGETVRRGEIIGYSGGNPLDSAAIKSCSGGPHLHVELYSADSEIHDIVPCLES